MVVLEQTITNHLFGEDMVAALVGTRNVGKTWEELEKMNLRLETELGEAREEAALYKRAYDEGITKVKK
jgi:hypothetical protein